jgi:hypothetical protein
MFATRKWFPNAFILLYRMAFCEGLIQDSNLSKSLGLFTSRSYKAGDKGYEEGDKDDYKVGDKGKGTQHTVDTDGGASGF